MTTSHCTVFVRDPGANNMQHSAIGGVAIDPVPGGNIDIIWRDPNGSGAASVLTAVPPFSLTAESTTQVYPCWLPAAVPGTYVGANVCLVRSSGQLIPCVVVGVNGANLDLLGHDPDDTANPESFTTWTSLPLFSPIANDQGTQAYPSYTPSVLAVPGGGLP